MIDDLPPDDDRSAPRFGVSWRCSEYARRKLEWLEQHPDAEAEEVEDAMRRIALECGL